MPKILPAAIVAEKNKLMSENPWIYLFEITISEAEYLRVCNNNENVSFEGNVYQAIPMQIDTFTQTKDGKIPSLSVSVSNVGKLLTYYTELYGGLVDCPVRLMVVNLGLLAEDYAELTFNFSITTTSIGSEWIVFSLGVPNPLKRRFPQHRYISKYCNWKFKSVECKYSGTKTTCLRTWEDCTAHANTSNFGGYPGLTSDGFRIVY